MGNKTTTSFRAEAYSMKLKEKYMLGEGAFGTVYKIMTKD
jgi:hypothetical protein